MSNLIYYPSSALLTQCADVNFDKIDVQQYYDSMIDVMYKNNGIGLAAPQVGLPWRFFLMHNNMYINPIIVERSDETETDIEGCLSFPHLWMKVKRAKDIVVEYYNNSGEHIENKFTGIESRCFQHELDHLDGICFNQRVSRLVFEIARKKQRKQNG